MKISLSRRVTAVVAALGLALVAVPAAAPAANADGQSCGLGETCDGVLSGPLGDSTFKIKVPENFNGTVLLYSKGYSSSVPIPAGIAVPLGYAASPYYSPMTIPGLGAGYAANGSATVVPPGASEAESVLLNQGYALAGTGLARIRAGPWLEGVESGQREPHQAASTAWGYQGRLSRSWRGATSLGAEIDSGARADGTPGKIAGNSCRACMALSADLLRPRRRP